MCGKIFRILLMSMVGICSAYGQTFSSYDYPGAYTTGLRVITGAGDIFGGYNNGPDNCCLYLGSHAFLLPGGLSGTPVSIDVTQQEAPGNQSTLLFAVNPGFQINGPSDYTGQVGGEYTDSGITVHGWIRTYNGTSSSFATIDPPGSTLTRLRGINDPGVAVGEFNDAAGVQHGFMLQNGSFTTFDVPFAGATFTSLTGINDEGDTVGIYGDAQGAWHGFRLSKGVYTTFDPSGSNHTEVGNFDNLRNTVGTFNNGGWHGFSLTRKGVFTQIDFPNACFTGAAGVDVRLIVGSYSATCDEFNAGIHHGFLRNP